MAAGILTGKYQSGREAAHRAQASVRHATTFGHTTRSAPWSRRGREVAQSPGHVAGPRVSAKGVLPVVGTRTEAQAGGPTVPPSQGEAER